MVGRFAFLPNVRTRLVADAKPPSEDVRRLVLSYDVEIRANDSARGARVPVEASLRGPGDVIGIRPGAIARVEPEPGLHGFETNYFPFIEFTDSDYAWRYSLDSANSKRIKPWLCLLALEPEEFEFVEQGTGPLPRIRVIDVAASLPDLRESWAFAHVQVNLPDDASVSVEETLAGDPARHFSRLLCPRRLQEGKAYALMLVPAYEAGRVAGLGRRETADPFDAPAWDVGETGSLELPVYHQTHFTTNTLEDVEVLLRRLRKLTTEEAALVGSPGQASAAKPGYYEDYHEPGASFDIQSALSQLDASPSSVETDPVLAGLMKETLETVIAGESEDLEGEDPLVSIPPYGWRFRGDDRVSLARARNGRWFDRINLDLRFRVAAALGAETIRRNQDLFSSICWDQYDEIVEANLRLARLGAARVLAERLSGNRYERLSPDVVIPLAEPAQAFIRTDQGQTLTATVRSKGVPVPFAGRSLRRIAAKRPILAGAPGSGRSIPVPTMPGDTRAASSELSGKVAAIREASFLTETGLSAELSDALGELLGNEPFGGLNRPRSAGVRVEAFDSAPFAASIVDTMTILPKLKADFTVAGRTGVERDALEPIFRSPVVPLPLADFLTDFSPQSILTDASRMPDETVGMFEENRLFIEAFMVGANHEMNRELRWREFPTDMRGTVMRRFWNRGRPPADSHGDSIAQIHTWAERLGSNFSPDDIDREANLVVVIRGGIIRKLGNLIVVLNEAPGTDWTSGEGIDHEPVFFGRIGADTAYYGFDVSRQHVLSPAVRDRMFFVFYEPMGRLRFGLDVGTAKVRSERRLYDLIALPFAVAALDRSYAQIPARRGDPLPAPDSPSSWDELSWSHMSLTGSGYVRFNRTITIAEEPDYWGSGRHAASLARSFWQKPVAAVMPVGRVL
jgi:hypothetical protein